VTGYAELANKNTALEQIWDRYSLSEEEWAALSKEERVIHYNRQNICEHKATAFDWPVDLRESYSMDPYFHTAHMDRCRRPQVSIDECPCPMCVMKIGIQRGQEHKTETHV